jgi:lysophospholipase L1-like esterase
MMVRRTFKLFLLGVAAALVIDEVIIRLFVPVRNVGPSFTEYDPVYGKSLKKNFSCERICPEFRMEFTTNSLGHRGPEPQAFPERGILFLGDSFTEGLGVSDGEEFPALVRSALIRRNGDDVVPVINAGIGNTGNGRWLKFLRREGKRYNPQLIVLQLMDNDFHENVHERLFVASENGTLTEQQIVPQGGLRFVQGLIEAIPGLSYSYLIGFIREAYWSMAAVPKIPEDDAEREKFDRITYILVDEIIRLCTSEGWPVLVMMVGFEPSRFIKMQAVVKKYHVPYIVPPSKSERPDLYFTHDGHWNEKGHEHAALMVLNAMGELGFPQPVDGLRQLR